MTIEATINPFEQSAGSMTLSKPRNMLLLLGSILLIGLVAAKLQLLGIGLFIALIFAGAYLYLLFCYPIIGLYTAVALSFILLGLARYVKDVPVGLGIDAILILTFLALFINRFHVKMDWKPANNVITVLSAIWFGYSLFQLINPEARSSAAWFSGRGVALYMFLIVPLTLMLVDTQRKMNYFLYIWGILSVLASLKGIMQLQFGLDWAEQGWLNEGNYKTHVLFGKLRVFSFCSDAGQFGGTQGYAAVVATIYSMAQTERKRKLFFVVVGLLAFYGMFISGTRGAISVPLAGFMTFFILRKNIKVLGIGVGLLAIVFIFFKYTNIGQGNDQIRRMRTAFDPNDASLQVRLENQRLLKRYLASRPFGGGIGHGGVKAQKYLPYAFLSQVATDSWYVLIWVEQGIVGLLLHLFILFFTLGRAAYKVMFVIRDPLLKLRISALIAGMAGVMVASYGNAVLGGMPTGMLIYVSMALMSNSDAFDTPAPELSKTTYLKPNKPASMKGKNFIITGLQSWDIPIGSNAIDITRQIAYDNRVLYVNSPLDMMTLFRKKDTAENKRRLSVMKKQASPLRRITPSLWVLDLPFYVWSINGLPDGFLFDFFNKLNNKKIFRYVNKVAQELGFTDPIHIIDNDIYRSMYAKDILRSKLSVYYRRDNVQPYAYWKKHAVRLEPKLIQKSDLVVCNSPQLADYARGFNQHSFDVGQGVDLSAYNPDTNFAVPLALRSIPQPRIGYIGDINSMRLDADLIYELAKSKPGYSFVMIGNEDKVFAAHALHTLRNVHFTGSIAKQQVPEYMHALDVCLNPQLINEITIGNYPRKVDEYLALGKPVIATTTNTMELFRDHVYLCNNVADYKDAVEKALAENSEEKIKSRIAFARSHSWKNNVQQIYNQIENQLK